MKIKTFLFFGLDNLDMLTCNRDQKKKYYKQNLTFSMSKTEK